MCACVCVCARGLCAYVLCMFVCVCLGVCVGRFRSGDGLFASPVWGFHSFGGRFRSGDGPFVSSVCVTFSLIQETFSFRG